MFRNFGSYKTSEIKKKGPLCTCGVFVQRITLIYFHWILRLLSFNLFIRYYISLLTYETSIIYFQYLLINIPFLIVLFNLFTPSIKYHDLECRDLFTLLRFSAYIT